MRHMESDRASSKQDGDVTTFEGTFLFEAIRSRAGSWVERHITNLHPTWVQRGHVTFASSPHEVVLEIRQ